MRRLVLSLLVLSLRAQQDAVIEPEVRSKRVVSMQAEKPVFEANAKVALLIGVGTYPEASGHQSLQYPAADVADLDQQLTVLGYRVTRLIDAQATAASVSRSLETLKNSVDGTFIFYFSGHGWQEQKQNHLATYDAGANLSNGLPMSKVLELVKGTGAKRQVLWIDACRNEPAKGAGDSGRSFGDLEKAEGTHVLLSTQPGGLSFERPELGHGVFTHFLLRSLSGQGAGPDKFLTVQDVSNYVIESVKNYNPGPAVAAKDKLPPKQIPMVVGMDTGAAKSDFLIATEPRGPRVGDAKTNAVDQSKYVWIPPGTFRMGCSLDEESKSVKASTQSLPPSTSKKNKNDKSQPLIPEVEEVSACRDHEKPPVEVRITRGFWFAESEVTQEAYQRVMKENPSAHQGAKDLPVERVAWDRANSYCQRIGGRLPTEAEWEYAARGGSDQSRYGVLTDVAWYYENSGKASQPVKSKKPNAYMLYDMLGNVMEWTADWYGDKLAGGNNPQGPRDGDEKVVRGGSFSDGKGGMERASFRGKYLPSRSANDYGFRCVSR